MKDAKRKNVNSVLVDITTIITTNLLVLVGKLGLTTDSGLETNTSHHTVQLALYAPVARISG